MIGQARITKGINMLTVNELFSGIGSQAAALERLGIDHKVVGIAEIDKYAIKSYEAIHGPVKNYGDISKIEKLDYADFWTYSFPCQDISVAGKQRGINENTRSGLLYEVERLLYKSVMYGEQPKWLMLENVKNLVGKKFKSQFDEWINRLDELGYNTYWQVLNAKNYGIPQNRERVFAISIRKDIDTGYVFPEPFELKTRLKDVLEDEVDEKFYLSEEYTKRFAKSIKSDKFPFGNEYKVVDTTKAETERMGTNSRHWVYDTNDCMSTLDATMYKQPKQTLEPSINQIGMLDIKGNEQIRRVYGDNGLSPTLNSMQGGNRQPKILEPCIAASRGRNPENPSDRTVGSPTEQRLEINQNGTSNTITTVQKDNYVLEPNVLTPKRTEYGKAIRKDYESGLISESRHNMTEMQPREDGICNTLTTVQKDNYVVEPMVCEQRTDEGLRFFKGGVCGALKTIDSCGDKRVLEPRAVKLQNSNMKGRRIKDPGEPMFTVTAHDRNAVTLGEQTNNFRIRKLTPLECWRLMGFTDKQFYKAEKVNSNSQLYKQAGNSIVVDVLYYLFKNLFIDKPKEQKIQTIESELPG